MPKSIHQSLLKVLRKLGGDRQFQTAKLARRRRLVCGERLEDRALLATITWGNAAGGNWNVASNWVGGVLPANGDDVVIPNMTGTPTITFNSGSISLRSLSIREQLVVSAGTFSATTITQPAGSFEVNGGRFISSELQSGSVNVSGTVTLNDVTIGSSATINVASNASVAVGTNSTLSILGNGNFASGSSVTLSQDNSATFSRLTVGNSGVLTAVGTTFRRAGVFSGNTSITVNGNGRLLPSNSSFDVSLFVPHTVLPSLSAVSGGSDNLRFQDIYIRSASTSALVDLLAIGTQTTANLNYIFNGDFSVGNTGRLKVFPGVRTNVPTGATLTINGIADFGVGSSLTLTQDNSATSSKLLVSGSGVLTANEATFKRSGIFSENTNITVSNNAVILPSKSRFDVTLYVTHAHLASLSAAGGGSDNLRFQDIYVRNTTLVTDSFELLALGTETTANLRFLIDGNMTLSSSAVMRVARGVKVWIPTATTLRVNGQAVFEDGSSLTLSQDNSATFSQFVVGSSATVTATGTTFRRLGIFPQNTKFSVIDGGRLLPSNSRFDIPLYVPYSVIPFLSAAGGGSDNARFSDIYISSDSLSGTLDLRAIGTESTANLNYYFDGTFSVMSNGTLNVMPGVRTWLQTSRVLQVNGVVNFGVGSSLTLIQDSSNSGSQFTISSTGTVTATDATFSRAGIFSDRPKFTVQGNGKLLASNSRFDLALYIPTSVLPTLSAAGGGSDNARFRDIFITTSSIAATTLDLRAIGTETTANLNYYFDGNFTVFSNATLNVLPAVRAWVPSGTTLRIDGTANLLQGSRLALSQDSSAIASLLVGSQGVVNAIGATIDTSGFFSSSTMTVSGELHATNSTIEPSILTFNAGAIVDIAVDDGSTRKLGNGGISRVLTNYQSIDVQYGSTLVVQQTLRVGESSTDNASLKVSYSSRLELAGNLVARTQKPTRVLPHGRIVMNGAGTATTPQILEVMGADLGPISAGFTVANFVFGRLQLANNTYVQLQNFNVNTVGAAKEALYVNTLVVPSGTKLDLNNLNVYTRSASIAAGSVINGTVTIVPDGGPLPFSIPTPGTIDDSQRTSQLPDEWTFTANQNLPVIIQVNPGATGATAPLAPQLQRVRVELLDSNNNVLSFSENAANGSVLTLQSANLINGQAYKIRVRPHSGFTSLTGNYMITLLETGVSDTAFSISPASDSISRTEGNSGSNTYRYNIVRTGDLTSPGSVSWAVAGTGTKPANAADFDGGVFPSGVVSFASLESAKVITVNVASDVDFEDDETFAVTLSSPTDQATILVGSASSTILNDDQRPFTDLVVASITPPSTARSGQKQTLVWTEKNEGPNVLSGTWSTNVKVVNRANGQVILDRTLLFAGNTLVSQASVQRSLEFDLPDGAPGTGNFDITIKVDSGNTVNENNAGGTAENNNTSTASFASTMADYPGLSVTQIVVPNDVQLSIPFDVAWTVLNSGTGPLIKSVRDRVYLSLDDKIDGSDRILATIDALPNLPLAAGATYTQTTSITLPLDLSITLGAYQILVETDFANDQFELDETNNRRNSPTNVGTPPLPDLIVDSITTSNLVVAGQSVIVSWVIKNQGTANASGTWSDRVFLSSDATIGNDLFLQTFPITDTLLPNGTILRTQQIQIPAGLSGDYRMVVRTDIGNTIQEFNREDNNALIDDEIITIDPRPSANLVVDSVTSLTSNLFTGQSATVEWVVRNIGNASTNTDFWYDRLYLSTDGVLSNDDISLGLVKNPSYLNISENYRSSLTVTLPQDTVGEYQFIVVTDATNRVPETAGENDNRRASVKTTIQLTPPPDLIVTQVVGPQEAFEGEPIVVSFTVRNQGTGPTRVTQWTDQVYLSLNGSDIDIADTLLKTVTHNGELAANNAEYSVANLSVLLPENKISGSAYLIVRTDGSRSVYEHGFEGNNDKSTDLPMQIFLRPRPELEVSSIVPVPFATAGQPIQISYTVSNTSVTATRQSSWRDSIYLSTDRNLDTQTDLLLGHRSRSGVLAGEQSESRSYSFNLPATLTGSHFIIVSTDSENAVPENDDTNNTTASANPVSIVVDPPDLTVTSLSTSTSPRAGRDLTINYSVRNSGQTRTPNTSWNDAVYLSSDNVLDAADLRLDQRQRSGALSPGQVENRNITFKLPADRLGSSFLFVKSDSTDLVYELNEDNNSSALSLFIGDDRPDLKVRSFNPRWEIGRLHPVEPSLLILKWRIRDWDQHSEERGRTVSSFRPIRSSEMATM